MHVNIPTGLTNKIQFDIRVYFIRRGENNMDFVLQKTRLKY